MNLFGLIIEAYGLRFCRPLADNCPMLSGAPAWLTKDRFDVEAKGPAGSKEYETMQLMKGAAPQLQEKLGAGPRGSVCQIYGPPCDRHDEADRPVRLHRSIRRGW